MGILSFFSNISGTTIIKSLEDCNIVADGNSLTTTQGGGLSYPSQLIALEPLHSNGSTMLNYAVGGQTTPQMISDAASQIDPQYDPGRARNILLAWEIRNDLVLNEPSIETAYNTFKSYCLARKSAGWEVYVGTMIQSYWGHFRGDDTESGYIAFNEELNTINGMIRSNWKTFANGVMDFAANPLLFGTGVNENSGYIFDPDAAPTPSANGCFFDGTHNTSYGKSILAQIALNAIKKSF